MCALIEVDDVTFHYDPGMQPALQGINLTIEQGEFLAILGANGSGKSTLAKHFNALLVPSHGKVLVDGLATNRAENTWSIRSKVGMVFQNPDNQIVAATVEQDVAFGPENLGVAPVEIRRRVTEALRTVGLESRRNDPPHLLSGGQKQRLAIAGILAMQPNCIVLDEPTAMLDPVGRAEVLATLRRLHGNGMTIVLITHFAADVVHADRIVVMVDGRIAAEGRPRELLRPGTERDKWGLSLPQAAVLAEEIRLQGVELEEAVLTADELVGQLCRLNYTM